MDMIQPRKETKTIISPYLRESEKKKKTLPKKFVHLE